MKRYERVFGVRGWGLDRPHRNWDSSPVGEPVGCTSETCAHNSHDPAAPYYIIKPPTGTVVRFLDDYPGRDESTDYYYVVIYGDGHREVLEVHEPRFYWSTARLVELHDEHLPNAIRLLALHASRDVEQPDPETYKQRTRQVRDALNKLRDIETLEEVAHLLRV